MVQLHPSHFREVVALEVKEKVVKEADGCLNGGRIPGAKPLIDVNEGPFGLLLTNGFAGLSSG